MKPNKNKEKEKDRNKNNNKNLYDNISKIHNDKKNIDLNKVSKYFYFWYNKGLYIKIKNKLRSLSNYSKFDKIKKNKMVQIYKKI